jgi:hypothetical protein
MAQTVAGLDAALGILDATVYLGVHDGAPGADGSTNELAGTRPSVAFDAAEAAGAPGGRMRKNTSAITFEDPGAGTYQAWSVWTANTAGTCLWVIPFDTNRTLTAGDDLRLPAGELECIIRSSADV